MNTESTQVKLLPQIAPVLWTKVTFYTWGVMKQREDQWNKVWQMTEEGQGHLLGGMSPRVSRISPVHCGVTLRGVPACTLSYPPKPTHGAAAAHFTSAALPAETCPEWHQKEEKAGSKHWYALLTNLPLPHKKHNPHLCTPFSMLHTLQIFRVLYYLLWE